ncbi:sensor histidine kinase [Croceibacterium aestuarii]|uniref:sensor histidine kinase n=1 Tax=Croceibacterium aestuarii TaxID=3064139 RepID=UPI00272E638E|nr:HAMP domain-containing sensor histidine kinase [Croceibacterium sp. D39]
MNSLRLRILLAVLVWVAVGIGAIWFSATSIFTRHVEQSFHDELDVHVNELARLARVNRDGTVRLDRPLSDPRYEVPLSGYYWQVDVDGGPPLRSESMTRGHFDNAVAHDNVIRHAITPGPTGPAIAYGFEKVLAGGRHVHFVIATDKSELTNVIAGFTRELTFWLTVLGMLLLATGAAVVSIGLRPLDRLGAAFARLRSGKTSQLEGAWPAEIAPLAHDLNDYIRQTGELITRSRVQAGNLAHSLRTPLAIITDEAERLTADSKTAGAARTLLEQSNAMGRQIDFQLARARSSAGAYTPGTVSELPELLVPIISAMRRIHPGIAFEIKTSSDKSVGLAVDPVDLAELLSNLIDNAGKWATSAVSVGIASGPEGTAIEISDDGTGMADEQLEGAFQIGTRFDPAKPGSGLGLAIALEIAQSIDARIELRNGKSGLLALVHFPPAKTVGT